MHIYYSLGMMFAKIAAFFDRIGVWFFSKFLDHVQQHNTRRKL
jgi:hypothetical protein